MRPIVFTDPENGNKRKGIYHQFVVLRGESGYDGVFSILEDLDGNVRVIAATAVKFTDRFDEDRNTLSDDDDDLNLPEKPRHKNQHDQHDHPF
jgi:hypothetical protein